MLTVVEKVIFLQDVDIFEFASTEDLSHIAMITEEILKSMAKRLRSLLTRTAH